MRGIPRVAFAALSAGLLSVAGCAFGTNGSGPVFAVSYWTLESLEVIQSASDHGESESCHSLAGLERAAATPTPNPEMAVPPMRQAGTTGDPHADQGLAALRAAGIPPILAVAFALDLALLPFTVPYGLTGWWR
jgi:hypothetical protein